MKKKKLTSLDILDGTVGKSSALSRTEMKQIMAGSGNCYITCDNCQNGTCQGWASDCSSVYTMCGPGYYGGGGPSATCVC